VLTPEHADFLATQGISEATLTLQGIYSITEVDQLPADFAWAGERAVPAIAFPWITPSGRHVVQLRPDTPVEVPEEDRPRKYLWPKGSGSPIGVARHDDQSDLVFFVEGTKQSLAVASHVSEGSVYAIAGCRTWSEDGVPVTDLDVAEGHQVLLCFDADVETNPDVWEAASKFTEALRAEGASDISYLMVPGGAKVGLDDVLGSRDPERRGAYLQRLVDSASSKLPKKPKKKAPSPRAIGTPDRPKIEVNADRHLVINQILAALKRWDGTRLFNYGGVLSELRGSDVDPLNRDKFCAVLAEGSTCVSLNPQGFPTYQWPDGPTLGAAMTKADEFTELARVSRMPIVRADGTICATSGYDAETRTMVILPDELEGLEVPELPTPEDVEAAAELLLEDWLVDFMPSLPTPSDRANLLGLMLTPLIRGLVPLVPLAVVDGLQAGVGKNLLADLLALLVTGTTAQPLPYARDDEEVRKVITSAFRSGAELFLFDEAHVVEGANFARALTSITYKDRVLGVSNMAEYPNNVTWVSLGNNVVVNGDMSRRVYRIALHSTVANPQDRPEVAFHHPDIRAWTLVHRTELVSALLTLIRAWYVAGEPGPAEPISFGSFERWAKIAGGVLHLAGIEGFLGNLVGWRSESDFERTYWSDHLQWLRESFGDQAFTTRQVQALLAADPVNAEMPPRMADPTLKGFSRELAQVYSKHRDRIVNGLRLGKSQQTGHGRVTKWTVSDVIEPVSEVREVSPSEGKPPLEGVQIAGFRPENAETAGLNGSGGSGGYGGSVHPTSPVHTRRRVRAGVRDPVIGPTSATSKPPVISYEVADLNGRSHEQVRARFVRAEQIG